MNVRFAFIPSNIRHTIKSNGIKFQNYGRLLKSTNIITKNLMQSF